MGNCNNPSNEKVQSPIKKSIQIQIDKGLNLVMRCWKQTHNNLFNFNLIDHQLNVQTINMTLKKVRIVKLNDEYQALLPEDEEFHKIMPPVMIDVSELREKDKFNQKKYTFVFNEFPKISKPFWIVIKSLPNKRYLLKQGDIFKMGKIKLRVKQIVYPTTETRDLNKNIQSAQFTVYDCQTNICEGVQELDNEFKCRICMQSGEKQNPLIGLCECSGTSKYTHFNCLKQWFTTQLNATKINMVTEVNWKTLECEFCRTKLPYSINLDNQTYYLVSFPKIKKPYLVLNPVYKANNEKSKIYYFVSFKKRNRMIIGRKTDSDIQICSDATMSRNHAVIEYVEANNDEQNGRFYLSDNKSKFGTVVLLNTKNPLTIDTRMNNVQFQVGGDLITIIYKLPTSLSVTKLDLDFNIDRSNIHELREFNQQEQQHSDNNDADKLALGSENDIERESEMFEHQLTNNKMLMKR